jgi:hypothetical protein
MSFTVPTNTDFTTMFYRDFPFGTSSTTIMDSDVTRAISEASFYINEGLFGYQADYSTAYLYVSAHCLVTNIKNSSSGISGHFSFMENSKSVGSVSQSFSIPESFTKDPIFSFLAKTSYGARYLELVLPLLRGNMTAVAGTTQS